MEAEQKQTPTDQEDEEYDLVVIDTGSHTVRAGFGDEDEPRYEYPCLVGRPRFRGVMVGLGQKDIYCGDEVSHIMQRRWPIDACNKHIVDWDGLEAIWFHTFYDQLRVNPEECRVVMTENIQTKGVREKIAALLFETFNVPSIYLASRSLMSLYASGRTTGVVVQVGNGEGKIVPIHEGKIIEDAISKLEVGGQDISDRLFMLCDSLKHTTPSCVHDVLQEIKEKYCYVAQDIEKERKLALVNPGVIQKSWDSDDPFTFRSVCAERFEAPEILFNPALDDKECAGIHQATFNAITKCDPAIQDELWRNVVLCGGTSMLSGLAPRLQEELSELASGAPVEVHRAHCKNSAWAGAAVFGSMPELSELGLWATKEMYDEHGPAVLDRMCI